MASRVSVQCPGCLAKLNLSDSSKLGKKIKCPKCSDIFVAETDDDEDMDDLDDEESSRSNSRRKRPAAGGKKGAVKKGKSSDGGSKGVLIGVGVVAVVALIGLGLFLSGVFASKPEPAPAPMAPMAMAPVAAPPQPPAISPTERMLALRWLPKETELLVHAKVSELWKAPLLKGLVESPQAAQGIPATKSLNLAPTDIDSVTVGFLDLQGASGMAMTRMQMGAPAEPPNMVGVVRTKKSVSLEEILKNDSQLISAEHNSKKYFEVQAGVFGGWVAEPTTVIVGRVAELKAIMDRGETVIPRQEFLFADANPHLVLIVAPKKLNSASVPMPGLSPEMAAMQKTIDESMLAVGLGVNVRGGFDLQTSLLLRDGNGTGVVKTGLESGLAEGRKMLDGLKSVAPALLIELAEQLLNNAKVETQSQVVKLSTNIPDSDQQKLEQLPAIVMMMAMTGGMGGGGGPSPFGGPPPPGLGTPPGPPPQRPDGPPADGKNPGETEAVPVEAVTGLPSKTTLTARTAWTRTPVFDQALKSPHPVQVMLDLEGDLSDVCGFGLVSLKNVALASGTKSKAYWGLSTEILNLPKVMAPFDSSEVPVNRPDGVLRVAVMINPPPADSDTEIDSLEGTFKILTSTDYEDILIDEVPKRAKRPLNDPPLKAAGVKLLLKNDPGIGDTLTLTWGKGSFIGNATAIYSSGGSEDMIPDVDKNLPARSLVARSTDKKFAPDLQLQLRVFKTVKEETVTFKFSKIPLPAAGTQPKPPAGPGQ